MVSMLVTRPEPEASDTAARLAALGIEPVMAPLLRFAVLDVTLPDAAGFAALAATSANGLRALAQQGMSADDMRKLDFNRLRAAQHDEALNEVKASLILDRIAEAENVEISDDDLNRELLMLSIQSREPLETLRERLAKDGGLTRLREQMRREKTGTTLYEKLAK